MHCLAYRMRGAMTLARDTKVAEKARKFSVAPMMESESPLEKALDF
jgi:hypothetical protein